VPAAYQVGKAGFHYQGLVRKEWADSFSSHMRQLLARGWSKRKATKGKRRESGEGSARQKLKRVMVSYIWQKPWKRGKGGGQGGKRGRDDKKGSLGTFRVGSEHGKIQRGDGRRLFEGRGGSAPLRTFRYEREGSKRGGRTSFGSNSRGQKKKV